MKTDGRSAHLGVPIDKRYPDPLMAWPEADIRAMLQGFARWSVRYRVEIFDLYTMCCVNTDSDQEQVKRWPYLLYASTKQFFFEGRVSHRNELVAAMKNPLTAVGEKGKPKLLSSVGPIILPPGAKLN